MKTKILIADDHSVVRIGLSTLLRTDKTLSVIGEAEDGEEAIAKTLALKPDIVIIDLVMPIVDGAVAADRILHEMANPPKIIILTTFGNANSLGKAIDVGVSGVLLKSAPDEELLEMIHRVMQGERVISPEVKQLLHREPPIPELSSRQRQVLEAVVEGLNNREIAIRLSLSPESVKEYLSNVFEKLGAANRTEAVAIAMRRHLIDS